MKTLQDKLRELSLDELNECSIQNLTRKENAQGMVRKSRRVIYSEELKKDWFDESLTYDDINNKYGIGTQGKWKEYEERWGKRKSTRSRKDQVEQEQLKKEWFDPSITTSDLRNKYYLKTPLYKMYQEMWGKRITIPHKFSRKEDILAYENYLKNN